MHMNKALVSILACLAGLWFGLASLTATASKAQDTSPTLTPYEASYSASMSKGVNLSGSGTRSLTDQGNNVWLYRTEVESFIADIDESLVFLWEDGHVVPLRYRYRMAGFLIRNREQSIDFDWQAGIAKGKYRDKAFELELREGALDPLGYQLQLHQDLKAGKRDVSYQVIDKARYDEDRFAVIDEESISANGQTTKTLKAEKVRAEDSKRQTLMWFDPNQNHLLVRLLQIEPDGSEYELRLKDATIGN
ncbi:DUF3108 domain-containing protein [Marinobacter halophilus]|uniref:DUF3108 domain-containing protein n=1 Tax=Marinobacter halophilus TaxID=1323740 RepID=A0A2T1KHY2_9GAMM|nr:DUF3108 domain-containing protein [Marinobacter halophilus]PSF09767.1 DUF3108 domain-containing protein [Marinobacter halophilus]GGC79640.1 hypothetical protein GCM10011362_30350 [Marinobacter halophilus]